MTYVSQITGADCGICLDNLNNGEKITNPHQFRQPVSEIHHLFHDSCIQEWMRSEREGLDKDHHTCPCCNVAVIKPKDMELFTCVRNESVECVCALAEKGESTKEDVLWFASVSGRLDIVEALLNRDEPYSSHMFLLGAAANGHMNVVQYLLRHGKIQDEGFFNRLMLAGVTASTRNNENITRYLLMNPHIQVKPEDALLFGTLYGHSNLVRFLLENEFIRHVPMHIHLIATAKRDSEMSEVLNQHSEGILRRVAKPVLKTMGMIALAGVCMTKVSAMTTGSSESAIQ